MNPKTVKMGKEGDLREALEDVRDLKSQSYPPDDGSRPFPPGSVPPLAGRQAELEQADADRKDEKFVPAGWIGLPLPGEQVEVVMPPDNRRGQMWKVVEILEGKPGRMVLEPVRETFNRVARRPRRGCAQD